jgi:hypothetical protein
VLVKSLEGFAVGRQEECGHSTRSTPFRTTVATVPIGTAQTGEAFQLLNEVAEAIDATTLKEELSPINVGGKTLNLDVFARPPEPDAGTWSPARSRLRRSAVGWVCSRAGDRSQRGRRGLQDRRPVGAAVLGAAALAREMSGKVNGEHHDVFLRTECAQVMLSVTSSHTSPMRPASTALAE